MLPNNQLCNYSILSLIVLFKKKLTILPMVSVLYCSSYTVSSFQLVNNGGPGHYSSINVITH